MRIMSTIAGKASSGSAILISSQHGTPSKLPVQWIVWQSPTWIVCSSFPPGSFATLTPFKDQESKLTRIKVQQPADLAHQEHLTQLLEQCSPSYQTVYPPKGMRSDTQEAI